MDSWVASDQVRALSSGEAELHGIVDGSARGIVTKHMYEEMGRTHQRRRRTDSTAAIGCVPERALERPDIFKFVGCGSKTPFVTRPCAEKGERHRQRCRRGTKDLDARHISAYCRHCRSSQPSADGLLGLTRQQNDGSVVEARMNGDEETLEKLSAQVMFVTLMAW